MNSGHQYSYLDDIEDLRRRVADLESRIPGRFMQVACVGCGARWTEDTHNPSKHICKLQQPPADGESP